MPYWRLAIFLAIISTLTVGIHVYIYRRLFRDTGLSERKRRLGAVLVVVLALGLVGGVAVNRFVPRALGEVIGYGSFVWMGLILFLVPALSIIDLLRVARRLQLQGRDRVVDPQRRLAMARGVAVATTLGAVGAGGASLKTALDGPVVRDVDVPLPGLPAGLDGFRIVQVSDIHVGPTIGRAYVQSMVDEVNALRPDLVAITGDLVDGTVDRLTDDTAPLADLKSTHGAFFVTGNHEYYSGAEAWVAEVGRLGVRVLRNERVVVQHGATDFDVLGVDDWRAAGMAPGHGHDLDKACEGRDQQRFSLLLAHQPKVIDEAAEQNLDLVLCGHTHGGQIWPANYLVKLVNPYVYGLHQHTPRTWIYVHAGTGYWGPPMRLKIRSEIVRLTLRAVPAIG